MARMLRMLTHLIPSLLLGFALGMPLRAQLDPRLQGSTTDLLDLFQQSNVNVKPEILTVFDFSASMQCLMYHPCYDNSYLQDNGDTTGITFKLTGTIGSFVVTASLGQSTWSTGVLTSTQLIRPDGSLVTEANVNTTPTGTGLWGDKSVTGAGSQACDVRNWVRAASHIRITNGGRTIDLPIPWKVMDRSSGDKTTSGDNLAYPLNSMKVKDEVILPDDQGVMTTYGTGQMIEVDTRYKIQDFPSGTSQQTIDNNLVLSGAQGETVTKTKYMLRLSEFYIAWLFNGTYQGTNKTLPNYTDNPSYVGKYIIFASTNVNLAAGQTNAAQGQGFGTFGTETMYSWDPVHKVAGTKLASTHAIPARDRVQAVKEAAIRTWIQYQTRVFWAYRFLDDAGEALNDGHGNATATNINYNSATTKGSGVPTIWTNGNDTGWTLFNGQSVTAMNRLAALFPYTNTPLCYAMARGLAQFSDPDNVFKDVETGDDAPVACQKHFLILFTDGIPAVDNNSDGFTNSPYITDYTTYEGNAQAGNDALWNMGTPPATGSLKPAATGINPGGTNWNIFTYAAIAAHLGDSSKTKITTDTPITTWMPIPTYSKGSAAPTSFLPFAIPQRGSQTISARFQPITTMTVGVSLGGKITDTGSPKRRLLLAAAMGDPNRTSWVLNGSDATKNLTSYTLLDPDKPSLGHASNSCYFFDATNPAELTKSLGYALNESLGGGNTSVTSSPNLPFIGASVGKQIYLGKFQPPTGGGAMWSGDLLMFPTKLDANSKTVILDKTGQVATKIEKSTAVWSASDNMPNWNSRTLYTRIPGASALASFTYQGTDYTDTSNGLKNFVATDSTIYMTIGPAPTYTKSQTAAQTAAQQSLIKMVMGADPITPSTNRSDIMGDVINSSPTYLEYDTATLPASVKPADTTKRFRLILVGSNQGWLHAFGETSSINNVEDPSSTTTPKARVDLVSGTVQELWAFMPTDFLANLSYLGNANNSHKFMVDGTPSIYFLDLPSSGGGVGNGKLDGANVTPYDPAADNTHERGIAIIGLRKGGRSYYALNIHNPAAPTLQWSLVPDEYDKITDTRNKTGLDTVTLQGIVKNMGYSTCAPSFGRILFNGVYKDAVFLGGGLSLPEIEAKFGTPAPLMGRSVLALDVWTGDFLAAVDLTSESIGGKTSGGAKTMVGPIPSGVVPFEFFLGSGMAQRAYFLDMWGGLWSWGSKQVVATTDTDYISSYRNFRKDTSELQAWSKDGTKISTGGYGGTGIRKIYQDAKSKVTATGSGSPTTYTYSFAGPMYTTPPSPFLVGNFPGKGVSYGTEGTASAPVAVGIAMVSGNRNNPLDYGTNNPANTRLTVVFDRQDSRAWSLDTKDGPDAGINTDAQLLDAGKWDAGGVISSTLAYNAASISPGNATYYLAPTDPTITLFGYTVTFPDKQVDAKKSSLYHYSKGINPPLVVTNTLYYAFFTPSTLDVCTGGEGYTYSFKICNVINPVASEPSNDFSCKSGRVDIWFNLASDFSMVGAPGVQQAGTRLVDDTTTGEKTPAIDTSTYLGPTRNIFPRARVWRTVR